MTARTTVPTIASAALLITTVIACGGDDPSSTATETAETTETTVAQTDPPETNPPQTNPPETTAPATTPDPDSTAEPAAPSTTTPVTSSPVTTVTTEASSGQPSPPLVATTELLVDGVVPLPDAPFTTGNDAGRYHSYRLGTEIVFDVPEPFAVAQHQPGWIAWDMGPDRILFIARWASDEALGPDEWIDELSATEWDITDTELRDISGNGVRRFDIIPTAPLQTVGGVFLNGAITFQDGLPRRVWIIDQDDGQPIVVGAPNTDDGWADLVDEIIESIELGPTRPDPRNGRAPLEYGFFDWSAEAGVTYRTLMFGGALVTFTDDARGLAGANDLGLHVPGDFSGTRVPGVDIGAAGGLVLPPPDDWTGDPSERAGGPPANAAALLDHIDALAAAGHIAEPRVFHTEATLLGETTTAVEFDVPGGAEVYVVASAPDGWNGLSLYTFQPARTHRVWTADVGDYVAIVIADADTGNTDDLDRATSYAETLMTGFQNE